MHLHYHRQPLSKEEKKNVTSITIDADAIHHRIPDKAFYFDYKQLTRVNIPDSITEIGSQAFHSCHSLTDIRLPQSLTLIGDSAFYKCLSITDLHIPDSVSKIGRGAFLYCEDLSHVNIPRGITELQEWTFCACTSLTQIDIPDGVITIGQGAFLKCTRLTHVNLPDGLQRLADEAFSCCLSLKQIHIPEGVEVIERHTFQRCRSLEYVYIPQSVRQIHLTAFLGCTTLLHQHRFVNLTPQYTYGEVNHWLRTRYDYYPFLKTCWKKNVTMVDIEQCVEEHGMDCLIEVEKVTGWNGLDILFLNQFIGNDVHVLDLIANIILMLLCQKGNDEQSIDCCK